ncbi:hypothetical protein GCM10027048_22160 [Hymenobacter coalescens]
MQRLKLVVAGLLGLALRGPAAAQTLATPGLAGLDSAYTVHGIRLGAAEGSVPWLRPTSSGFGKRWRHTRLYAPKADTVTLCRQRADASFWFRGGRYIGATYLLPKSEQKTRRVQQMLTRRYGPPRPANVPNTWYWLGRRTYILYEDGIPQPIVHVAGLGMLNEQVMETSVRQEARTALGWQPDSLGLPRQFDLPAAKKK